MHHRGPIRLALALFILAETTACKPEDGDSAPRPDLVCPGDPSCPDEGEAVLYAGAAMRDVTPEIVDYQSVDANGNSQFEPPPLGDDEWFDGNGNGEWDFVYIAGLGNPRPARDVHDPITSRVLVLRWKSTTIAIVSLDLIGYFASDIADIREAVSDLDIDFVSVSSTHNHEGPDTVGIWGMDEAWPGWRQEFFDTIGAGTEAAIREAYENMVPAQVTYNQVAADSHPTRGICNVQSDGRPPVIFAEDLTVLHFTGRDGAEAIGTLVHFTAHPESSDDHHQSLSADFVYWLRMGIEDGIDRGDTLMPGLSGTAVFIQGPVGSQIGPGDVICEDLDGTVISEKGFALAECIGWNLAKIALEAVDTGEGPEQEVPLEVRAQRIELPVENYGYHAMMLSNIFHRDDVHGFDDTRPASVDNLPWIWTEVSWLRIGRAQAIGLGGEPNPEIFFGGYDGSRTPACAREMLDLDMTTLSQPDNENPPDLSLAPGPPYMFDRLENADFPMAWAVTNDMLGYLIPEYNYILARPGAYITEAPGEHYEETNSVGENAWPIIRAHLVDMLTWRP
ncbi:MAG: hypothetical protein JRG91_08810 [Deltaproteobacteria bacterium]|nr:hypothetical protein [Deltaproteobacteria bacterium]